MWCVDVVGGRLFGCDCRFGTCVGVAAVCLPPWCTPNSAGWGWGGAAADVYKAGEFPLSLPHFLSPLRVSSFPVCLPRLFPVSFPAYFDLGGYFCRVSYFSRRFILSLWCLPLLSGVCSSPPPLSTTYSFQCCSCQQQRPPPPLHRLILVLARITACSRTTEKAVYTLGGGVRNAPLLSLTILLLSLNTPTLCDDHPCTIVSYPLLLLPLHAQVSIGACEGNGVRVLGTSF